MAYTKQINNVEFFKINENTYVAVLQHHDSKRIFKLNRTGYLILSTILNSKQKIIDVEGILEALKDQYRDVNEAQLRNDVIEFLEKLEQLNIISKNVENR